MAAKRGSMATALALDHLNGSFGVSLEPLSKYLPAAPRDSLISFRVARDALARALERQELTDQCLERAKDLLAMKRQMDADVWAERGLAPRQQRAPGEVSEEEEDITLADVERLVQWADLVRPQSAMKALHDTLVETGDRDMAARKGGSKDRVGEGAERMEATPAPADLSVPQRQTRQQASKESSGAAQHDPGDGPSTAPGQPRAPGRRRRKAVDYVEEDTPGGGPGELGAPKRRKSEGAGGAAAKVASAKGGVQGPEDKPQKLEAASEDGVRPRRGRAPKIGGGNDAAKRSATGGAAIQARERASKGVEEAGAAPEMPSAAQQPQPLQQPGEDHNGEGAHGHVPLDAAVNGRMAATPAEAAPGKQSAGAPVQGARDEDALSPPASGSRPAAHIPRGPRTCCTCGEGLAKGFLAHCLGGCGRSFHLDCPGLSAPDEWEAIGQRCAECLEGLEAALRAAKSSAEKGRAGGLGRRPSTSAANHAAAVQAIPVGLPTADNEQEPPAGAERDVMVEEERGGRERGVEEEIDEVEDEIEDSDPEYDSKDMAEEERAARLARRRGGKSGPSSKSVRFSPEEDAMLRNGFARYENAGEKWKKILAYGRNVFNPCRDPMSLKDRWRNLKKTKKA